MELAVENAHAWSEAIFGSVELGDKRLTKRLMQIGKQLSSLPGSSLSESCEGQDALLEGSYRFLRNKRVNAKQIAEGGYQVTSLLSQAIPTLLAIEDTTTLSYTHQVKENLGDLGGPKEKSNRGFHVHTTLLMDAEKEKTIGLIAQNRWCRSAEERGKKFHRRVRQYSEKESYKWEKNTREIESQLGSKMPDVISVCDREADIFEYIQYKLEKMIVILSFVAVRLLQLKEHFEYPSMLEIDESIGCEELLTETEWKVLWNSVEKKPLPESTPTATWAYQAIAKLGGWTDSKKTGKAAWATIWKGWFRLKERLEGLRIAREMMKM